MVKYSQNELLIESISIDFDGSILVFPFSCPGVNSNVSDILLFDNRACCFKTGERCKYFIEAKYNEKLHDRDILCKLVQG